MPFSNSQSSKVFTLATPAQIDEQVQFERDAIKQGIERLHKNTRDLEEKAYSSASVYGCSSISVLMPVVRQRIEDTKSRIKKGYVGKAFSEINQHLEPIDSGVAAAIALKVTFDKVFSYKDKANLLISVSDGIGTAIEQEAQMQFYENNCPGLLAVLKKNYWHNTTGTKQKYVIIKTLMQRYEVPQWSAWGRANRVKLGTWLLDCIIHSSNWFTIDKRRLGKKTDNYIIPTPEFIEKKDELMATAELFSPIAYPMLIEPNDWAEDRPGGYLLNEVMRGHDMVRRGTPRIQGETPINFLNKIQKVGFCINSFTYDVATTLMEKGRQVGKFVPIVEYDLPPKPVDIAENEQSRQEYRRNAAETMNLNAASFKKSCRTRMTMEAAKLFKDKKEFFIPWSFDYRGRAYPIPAFLTPQDTDFGKSLLSFSEPAYLTPYAEEWLAFSVATTYGLDKEPIHKRMEWVHNNKHLITAIAEDPLGCLPEWEAADEPWQFLAACDEYYHCLIKCDRDYTSLPVAVDATCSGIQVLAGLFRDRAAASLVNVLPGEKPADAYAVVAKHAKPNCPISIQPFLDRKVVKRVVMTVPYNSRPYSNRSFIRDALKEKGVEIGKDDLTATVNAVRASMEKVLPGPMAGMRWIETEVAKVIKKGATQLEWVTPSGFVVVQKLNKKTTERLTLKLLGTVKIHVATQDSDEVDLQHHKSATSPNLIHSLDSSLLHLSTLRFDAPIALIHDSVLCRATDMSSLSEIVRETYMKIFAEDSYIESWAQQIGAETKPPIIGDLRPESVTKSTYFFC
jgi:DNA-directed RNA polymerase